MRLVGGARAAALALLACVVGCGEGEAPLKTPDGRDLAGRPDVVLILIDTLRPDHLGFYGHAGRETAPFLAKLARRGTVFERAFSTSSWTAPSTASVFTSLYPNQHGVIEGFFRHDERVEGEEVTSANITLNRLPREVATLPEALQAAGYSTFGVAANVNIGADIGFDRGFDRFVRLPAGRNVETLTSPDVLGQLLAWRKEIRQGSPSFVYLHFNDVHQPHAGVTPWYEASDDEVEDQRRAYDSEITYLDKVIQQIHQRFDWKDAIVMVVSDHGQEFMEHGQIGHKATLYRELLQVLMMVTLPERAASTSRPSVNVSLIDVAPTLADLAGVPPDPEWRGRSLAPFVRDDGGAPALHDELDGRVLFAHRANLVAQTPYTLFGAIRGDWQLIFSTKEVEPELYDFVRDPLQAVDAFGSEPGLARDLREELERFRGFAPVGTSERIEVELDDTMLEDLQSLGYVGD